jgi:hypothetical protein
MIEKPTTQRSSILINGNSLEINIPAKKKWFAVAVMCLWLIGFVIGGKMLIDDSLNGDNPSIVKNFLIFGVAGWSVAVVCTITMILWLTGGVEIVKVDGGILELRKQIFSVGLTRKYQIDAIRHLTINSISDDDQFGFGTSRDLLSLKGGVVKFDYGMKTIKFGAGIDEAEGRLLIQTLRQNSNFNETNFG